MPNSWEFQADGPVLHVWPDGGPHATTNCPCGPAVKSAGLGLLVVHHSLDGRETRGPNHHEGV